jgi:hypothetical protein
MPKGLLGRPPSLSSGAAARACLTKAQGTSEGMVLLSVGWANEGVVMNPSEQKPGQQGGGQHGGGGQEGGGQHKPGQQGGQQTPGQGGQQGGGGQHKPGQQPGQR